jgi:cytidylate kinase
MIVAIDGPAGAGKSTVARATADALGFTYLDSGAMYRAVGLALLEEGGAASDQAERIEIQLGERVIANGRDVTEAIRAPEVSEAASKVATNQAVRAALVVKQRELLAGGDWVAEGRDIGTVVAPDAAVKVFLVADPAERARRRAAEIGSDATTVQRDQALRDAQDSSREHSPLRPAEGSVELDTTDLTVDEVVARIVALVADARHRAG